MAFVKLGIFVPSSRVEYPLLFYCLIIPSLKGGDVDEGSRYKIYRFAKVSSYSALLVKSELCELEGFVVIN